VLPIVSAEGGEKTQEEGDQKCLFVPFLLFPSKDYSEGVKRKRGGSLNNCEEAEQNSFHDDN
jgi:hypothetical protein